MNAELAARDVAGRDMGLCVRCGRFCVSLADLADQAVSLPARGRGVRWSIHHRVAGDRSDMRMSNLLLLCGSGTTGCHGWCTEHPALAEAGGWSVSRYSDTLAVAVLYGQATIMRRGRFTLSDDGTLEAA